MFGRKGLSIAFIFIIGILSFALLTPQLKSSASVKNETTVSAAGGGGLDLIATGLEVTQGTQNLNNSVRLVANKTTYVRFYVRSNGENAVTTARLTVTRGANSVTLVPVNPGGEVNVLANPNRLYRNQSFLFQLPEAFTAAGTLALSAEVNPAPRNQTETDYANNIWQIGAGNLQFENVPSLDLVVYNIGYRLNGVDHWARENEQAKMVDWMRRALPVSQINFEFRRESIRETLGADRLPTCEEVNKFLAAKRTYDLQTNAVSVKARYYGMVSDKGDFMRGCADNLPGFVSSGPTGETLSGGENEFIGKWKTDNTYGDFYGAHEVLHNLNRYHAEFCEASDGQPFPNPGGGISPSPTGNNAVFGFDIGTGAIYGTNWTDNMAYCPRQWISDFTHNGVMNFIQQNLNPLNQPDYAALPPVDSLLVSGTIYPGQTPAIRLNPAFFIDDAVDVTDPQPGNYAVVLRNSTGGELLRHAFTPEQVMEEEDVSEPNPTDAPEILAVNELVPSAAGTTRVDVEAPNGTVLGSITAGINNPSVLNASVGAFTPRQPVTVNWSALDLDGDPLSFNIQYSDDNGASWRIVSAFLKSSAVCVGPLCSTSVDTFDITGGAQAKFRVIASDGIHTGSAETGTFNVPNNEPTAAISEPGSDTTITLGESLTLRAEVYDVDEGVPPASEMQWSSSINGALGSGSELTVANLSLGEHTITFTVNDGNGGIITDEITVEVTTERVRQSVNDYDGDGETDVAVFRPSNGTWYIAGSDDVDVRTVRWGQNGDLPVQADYDGDGSVDLAVFRPANGTWYIRESGDAAVRIENWGLNGDVPAAADYDGDAKIDLAVFRPANGMWYIKQSSDGAPRYVRWGLSGDVPVVADYDGDTLTDVAVYRPSNNVWYILKSSDGGFRIQQFGLAGDVPAVEDYDGDGEADISIFRPSTGFWWTLRSSDPTNLQARQWGANADKPVAGDYDGDGIGDLVVFRPAEGLWYILNSSNGTIRYIRFGLSTDTPV